MRQRTQSPMSGAPPLGGATKILMGSLLGASLISALTQRYLNFGTEDLVFTVSGVLDWEVWRLVTFPFVELRAWDLLIGLVLLFFFGRFLETQWGSRHYLRFFLISSFGAAILAIPLSIFFDIVLPFRDTGMAAGPEAAFDAMLMALALTAPDSNVLFGFVLPVRAKTLVYLLLGLQLVMGIMEGAAGLGVTVGGIIMGYLLVTGMWRPERLATRWRVWTLRKRRRGLHVVPTPGDRTLH